MQPVVLHLLQNMTSQNPEELEHQLRLEKSINEHLRLEVIKLQKSLDEANKRVTERDQQLAEANERLHVSQQVTAATQGRALREDEGIHEQLIAENREYHVYEQLLKDIAQCAVHGGRGT